MRLKSILTYPVTYGFSSSDTSGIISSGELLILAGQYRGGNLHGKAALGFENFPCAGSGGQRTSREH